MPLTSHTSNALRRSRTSEREGRCRLHIRGVGRDGGAVCTKHSRPANTVARRDANVLVGDGFTRNSRPLAARSRGQARSAIATVLQSPRARRGRSATPALPHSSDGASLAATHSSSYLARTVSSSCSPSSRARPAARINSRTSARAVLDRAASAHCSGTREAPGLVRRPGQRARPQDLRACSNLI